MDFLKLAEKRCSVRKYLSKPVEDEKLRLILEAGRIAPTAANLQPVKVIAVRSKENLEKLGKSADIYGAPLALIILADRSKAWTRPFDKMQTTDIDASIVTAHMMLESASLGLGSVWICYFNPDVLRTEFDIPEDLIPVNILAVGYPSEDIEKSPKIRNPIDSFVCYDKLG
ncbi:MAG: nitroreductase family protein [Oscillospiraceae bacterium]|nr:nitroreductase family protein [Oscillospiraceae bacterium]